jgi:hypothetical protein
MEKTAEKPEGSIDPNPANDGVAKSETSNTNASTGPHVEWTKENEKIMVEWCDVAQCYKWLNARAHSRYSYMHAWFTIPAIVLSTISGTASFAQTSLPVAYQTYSPMAIGAINIFIGILTTVQQYLKISELNEAHRVSSISWDKFARNIRIELAKKPDERMRCEHFLKINRQEFDRLMETSPMVTESIVAEFNKKFKDKPGFDRVKKPDICDVITSVDDTRYKPEFIDLMRTADDFDNELNTELFKSQSELILAQREKIKENEAELKRKKIEEAERVKRELDILSTSKRNAKSAEQEYDDKIKKITDYIASFEGMYERKPLSEEIYDNLNDIVDIVALKHFLETYDSYV